LFGPRVWAFEPCSTNAAAKLQVGEAAPQAQVIDREAINEAAPQAQVNPTFSASDIPPMSAILC
jgi:hypothetical protein